MRKNRTKNKWHNRIHIPIRGRTYRNETSFEVKSSYQKRYRDYCDDQDGCNERFSYLDRYIVAVWEESERKEREVVCQRSSLIQKGYKR